MLLAFLVLLTLAALGVRSLVGRSRSRRRSAQAADDMPSFWPVALLLGGLCVVPFVLSPGRYVVDTQFLFGWNPQRMLDGATSIWQVKLDLGGTTPSGPLLPTAFVAVLRGLGAPAWLAQRFWFAGLLALGTIGAAAVAHYFLPRLRVAALAAGLVFLATPFTVGYFFPTWLFLSAAVCPWLVLAVLRGTTTSSRWRWAAVAALLGTAATFNLPALVFAMIPVVGAFVYVRVSGRARWRAIVTWIGCVAVFVLPILAPYLLAVVFQVASYQSNLASTESFVAISQSSSWAESIRGLGGWLVYWNPGGRLVLPYVAPYLSNWLVVVATFVPVVAAIAVVAVSRRRARLLFGAVVVVCAAIMVGGYPLDAPSPLGVAFTNVFDGVSNLLVFRNVYKAGAGLVLAVAVLVAFGVEWFLARWPTPRIRAAGAAVAVVVLVASAFPLWSGGLLRNGQQIDHGIPAYWYAATKWLDAQPGDGRVLVAPVSDANLYRWGDTTGGDMFTSLLSRPVVLGGAFASSPGDAGDLVQALVDDLSSGRYQPGTLAPIARRLGISYLVIRNDLDWQGAGGVRPADLNSLRQDPTLDPVADFGRPGENTTSAGNRSAAARRERRLPPVEIFRIPGARGGARVVSQAPALLVSGDGEAWPELAAAGLLDDLGPVRYTGRIDRATLRRELAAGATVAVTDTNRRASVLVGVARETLAADATGDVGDRFERPGSQTVATFGDATDINEVGPPRLFRPGPAHRAWAAFDGDPATSWLTGNYTPILGEYLDVRLKRPERVSSIAVRAATPDGGRVARSVRVWLDDGKPRNLELGVDHTGTLTFAPETVRHIRIAVTALEGEGAGPYGLADVTVGNLDLARKISVPDDVTRIARHDPEVRRELESSPTQFLFARQRAIGEDPEPTLRREFSVPAARYFSGSMTLQIDKQTTAAARALLVDGPASPTCRTDLLAVDGTPVGVSLASSLDALGGGATVSAKFCNAIPLGPGRHTLTTPNGLPVDRVQLEAVGGRAPVPAAALVSRTRSDATSAEVRVGGDRAAWVISGQAMASQWSAQSGGHDLPGAEELDTQAGWALPAGSARVVETSFTTQSTYRLAFILSVVAMALAYVTLIVDPRRRARRLLAMRAVNQRAWRIAFEAAALVFVFAIGGAIQVGVLLVVLVALWKRWLTPAVVTLVAAVLLVVAIANVVPPLGPSLRPIDPTWPLRRDDAQFFVLQGVVLFVGGLVGFARQALARAPSGEQAEPSRVQSSGGAGRNGDGSRDAPAASATDAPTAPILREHLR